MRIGEVVRILDIPEKMCGKGPGRGRERYREAIEDSTQLGPEDALPVYFKEYRDACRFRTAINMRTQKDLTVAMRGLTVYVSKNESA